MAEILDPQEVAESGRANDVSSVGQHENAKEQASDFMRWRPEFMKYMNIVYLDLQCDSPELATVKVMDPTERCMLTPDSLETCLFEEIRSGDSKELHKLLEYHLVKFQFESLISFSAMLLVAHGATTLLQAVNANGLGFSSLPYGVRGLKPLEHRQRPALAGRREEKNLRLSRTTVEDRTSELLKERHITELHFHPDDSRYDWQCFVDTESEYHKGQFRGPEERGFERTMAAAIEIFEHGQAERQKQAFRPGHEKDIEVIARAKYLENVKQTRVEGTLWSNYLVDIYDGNSAGKTALVVPAQDQPSLDITMASKEIANSGREEQLGMEANADIAGTGVTGAGNVGSGAERNTDEAEASDAMQDGRGSILTAPDHEHDPEYEADTGVHTPSANARKRKEGKGRRNQNKKRKPRKDRQSLTSKSDGRPTEEDDVVALTKSGSSTPFQQNPLVNIEKAPDPALHPSYYESSRSSSYNMNINHYTAPAPAESVTMGDVRRRLSTMSLEEDREHSDVGELQRDDSEGENNPWQLVARGKTGKQLDQNPAIPTPSPRQGTVAATATAVTRSSSARRGQRTQGSFVSKSATAVGPASEAIMTPTFDDQEFPDLPALTQTEEAIQKVMAKKKKKKKKTKKNKGKKKNDAHDNEPSQSSNNLPGYLPVTVSAETYQQHHQSQTSNTSIEDTSEKIQDTDSPGTVSTTDDDTTPKGSMINTPRASMINLVAAHTSQPGSTSAPQSSLSANQPGSPGALQSVGATPPDSTSAPRPSTSTSQSSTTAAPESSTAPEVQSAPAQRLWIHKFGAFEGPTRIVCRAPGCDVTTSPWDGSTVICPYCGPYSSIRYCSIEHLLNDTADHWGVDCMKYTCNHPCDASTVHPRQVQCPPALPNLCGWNTPERHRQAVYHAHSTKKNGFAEIEGDYFIFTDARDWMQAGTPDMQAYGLRRGRGGVLLVVTFDDDGTPNSLKDRFNRLLNAALFTGASNALILNYLFLMIRENLLDRNEWDNEVLDSVFYQFQYEFCYQLPDWVTNNKRHACLYQWAGLPVDQCPDPTCNSQLLHPVTRRPLLPRLCVREKVEELERRYWLLRVARVYHPSTPDQAARMRGVGFEFVSAADRREFCMGRAWEGYPAGNMEVEGAMWVGTANGPPALRAVDLETLTV